VHGRFLTDDSFEYLDQYLMLCIYRIRMGSVMEDTQHEEDVLYEMAKDIQSMFLCTGNTSGE
jgi:hypothetical protein